MSVTAQKQDISDPEVIHRFATLVGSRDRLDYLYLLTCADIAGTSPKLWNAWKDRLLADLYFAARRALRDGLENQMPAAERVAEARDSVRALVRERGYDDATIDRQFAVMPDESFIRLRPEQLAWQAAALVPVKPGQTLVKVRRITPDDHALEVFVQSPDRDGLFAAIVMTLDRKGYGIHRARVLDGPVDTIFDTFEVTPADSFADGDAPRLEAALRDALAGDLTRLRPSRRVIPRQLRHFRFAPRIEFRDGSDGSPGTRFSLIAPDRPGLLADVAFVLRNQRLRVHDARIATFGERAEDMFVISDEHDHPLTESARQQLHDAMLACLDPDRNAGDPH
jgi:[protein-PII] uridylyltransferase